MKDTKKTKNHEEDLFSFLATPLQRLITAIRGFEQRRGSKHPEHKIVCFVSFAVLVFFVVMRR